MKSDLAFRTIAEASEELGVPAHVLRFWEGKFTQIRPLKRAGGRRHYRPDDMALLRGIRALLQEDGYQLKGVQKILRDQGVAWVRQRGGEIVTGGTSSPQDDIATPIAADVGAHDRDPGPLFAVASAPVQFLGLSEETKARLSRALAELEQARQRLQDVARAS
ncbi:MAG: hypothetical protein RLZZ157_1590 [Pseudomonadota bacterium]